MYVSVLQVYAMCVAFVLQEYPRSISNLSNKFSITCTLNVHVMYCNTKIPPGLSKYGLYDTKEDGVTECRTLELLEDVLDLEYLEIN